MQRNSPRIMNLKTEGSTTHKFIILRLFLCILKFLLHKKIPQCTLFLYLNKLFLKAFLINLILTTSSN